MQYAHRALYTFSTIAMPRFSQNKRIIYVESRLVVAENSLQTAIADWISPFIQK